jgi:hypothetical protein
MISVTGRVGQVRPPELWEPCAVANAGAHAASAVPIRNERRAMTGMTLSLMLR